MKTMKLFISLLIVFVLFYFFVDFICFIALKTSYGVITGKVEVEDAVVEIEKAEATAVNGKVIGKIRNESENEIVNQYIRVTLLSEQGENLGSKYVKLDKLSSMEEKAFEVDFRAKNVKHYLVSLSETMDESKETMELLKLDSENQVAYLLSALILMYFFL
ncbi:MAG: FxLYD domain-containing protein [Clostridia bacterium]|jgi:hypothetical protein